jgi:hypothetical protein
MFDAEFCRHCQAPMALSRQADSQKAPPVMVATIGSAGTGKTVYLGMLTDMLSRQNKALHVLARGAFSISLQQSAIASLARCEFPAKTPNEPNRWNWMHCQVVQSRRRSIELIMPDPAGEAILHEIDHPQSYPVIRALLSKCRAAMLLVDAAQVEQGEPEQDFLAMKIVSYLCELNGDAKTGWPGRPVAVILTKADQSGRCSADPAGFVEEHAPGLWRQCRERLHHHRFFAAGVAGACAYRSDLAGKTLIPLRIEPHGIVEPFVWLIDQLPR